MTATSHSGAKPKRTAEEMVPGWSRLVELLQLVRDVRAADEANDLEQRRIKLRQLARDPYFASFLPDREAEARGRIIVTRILHGLSSLRDELPPAAKGPDGLPEHKAILLWYTLIDEGLLSPVELSRRLPELFTSPRAEVRRRAGMMRRVMWHPGDHPTLAAQPGIESIAHTVRYVVEHPSAGGSEFDLEWARLQNRPDQLQLLGFLAFMAPAPMQMVRIREGAHILPSPLRRTLADPQGMQRLRSFLVKRMLLCLERDQAISLPERVRPEIRSRTSSRERKLILDRGLRFLTEVLPPDSHHWASWPTWSELLSHLDAALAEAADLASLRMRRAHLFDRRSVYYRTAEQNYTQAIADAHSAVELAEAAGVPDASEYAIYLGNLAIAEDFAGQFPAALAHFDKSLEVTLGSRGKDNDDYAGTLELKANALSHAGHSRQARAAYAQAEKIIRRVYAADPSDEVTQVYREILNDYAAFLLRDAGLARRPGDLTKAEKMLREAAATMQQTDAGWFPVQSNLVQVAIAEERWPEAYAELRGLLTFCEANFGPHSLQTFATVRDLTDVCRALNRHTEAEEYDQRAHEIDDLLAAADDMADEERTDGR